MKNLFIKRWSSILVVFALLLQVWAPAVYAVGEDNTDTENTATVEATAINDTETDLSNVTSEDAVEVLDNALDDEGNDDEEMDDVVNNLLDEANTDSEAESLIQKVQTDVENSITDLESEANTHPLLKLKITKKILKLRAFLTRLKARLIMNHIKIADVVKRVRKGRHLYRVRWGVLDRKDNFRCPNLDSEEIKAALDAEETPDCDVVKADYEGTLSVNKGELKVRKLLLFEKNDEMLEDSGKSIKWTSHIAGHWDGFMVEYLPGDEEGDVEITLSIGDVNDTFGPDEIMGRKEIGNGHIIEIKPLAAALAEVAGNVQDKLVENRVRIQNKIDKIRERLRRIQLLRSQATGDVSDESGEMEDLLGDVEEYNFDDTSSNEIGDEVDAALTDLSDGVNKDKILKRVQHLRKMFVGIKDKAKIRKFAKNIIPFKDTDDNEWYTKYVAPMKEKGIVSGFKDAAGNDLGEYRPANNVTVAEMLKIGLETSNNGQSEGVPVLKAALKHWAKAYVKRAEELGLDMVSGNPDLNRPATRGEVIRMMLEAAGFNPDVVSGTSFSDVPTAYKHAAYIALAKKLGIVSGDDYANTFRPDSPINRAEVAKIADKIMELLQTQ